VDLLLVAGSSPSRTEHRNGHVSPRSAEKRPELLAGRAVLEERELLTVECLCELGIPVGVGQRRENLDCDRRPEGIEPRRFTGRHRRRDGSTG
jgi:hypothetical protein